MGSSGPEIDNITKYSNEGLIVYLHSQSQLHRAWCTSSSLILIPGKTVCRTAEELHSRE